MEFNALRIDVKDNVAVALKEIPKGEWVRIEDVVPFPSRETIPMSHKVALASIPKGDGVFRYGEMIGRAATSIGKGEWVHIHNLTIA